MWNQYPTDKTAQRHRNCETVELDYGSCASSKGAAKRAPYQRMQLATTSEARVAPRPMLKLERSLMAPMICGEKVSPKKWMQKRLIEMAVARTGAATELTMAVFRGPVLRKRKNSARKSDGTAQDLGPKKSRIHQGRVSATLHMEKR